MERTSLRTEKVRYCFLHVHSLVWGAEAGRGRPRQDKIPESTLPAQRQRSSSQSRPAAVTLVRGGARRGGHVDYDLA